MALDSILLDCLFVVEGRGFTVNDPAGLMARILLTRRDPISILKTAAQGGGECSNACSPLKESAGVLAGFSLLTILRDRWKGFFREQGGETLIRGLRDHQESLRDRSGRGALARRRIRR